MTPQLGVVNCARQRAGPGLIAAILMLAVVVQFLAQAVPSVAAVTMPRFGWVGLMLCLNPLLFLLPWLGTPTRSVLMSSGFMTCTLGVVNAGQLLYEGTVSIVTHEGTDRLHSSWFWSVLPFFVAGGYLYWRAVRMPPLLQDLGSGEQAAPSDGDKLSK